MSDEHLWDLFDDVASAGSTTAQQPDSDEVGGGTGQLRLSGGDDTASLDELGAQLPPHWRAAVRAVVQALVADRSGAVPDV